MPVSARCPASREPPRPAAGPCRRGAGRAACGAAISAAPPELAASGGLCARPAGGECGPPSLAAAPGAPQAVGRRPLVAAAALQEHGSCAHSRAGARSPLLGPRGLHRGCSQRCQRRAQQVRASGRGPAACSAAMCWVRTRAIPLPLPGSADRASTCRLESAAGVAGAAGARSHRGGRGGGARRRRCGLVAGAAILDRRRRLARGRGHAAQVGGRSRAPAAPCRSACSAPSAASAAAGTLLIPQCSCRAPPAAGATPGAPPAAEGRAGRPAGRPAVGRRRRARSSVHAPSLKPAPALPRPAAARGTAARAAARAPLPPACWRCWWRRRCCAGCCAGAGRRTSLPS